MDLEQLLGAVLGLVAGLALWFWRRRRAERTQADRVMAGAAVRPGALKVLHEVKVQGPLLHEIPGGRYEIGDNSATRAEIEEFMARGPGRTMGR